jgi:hypothetical protein
LLHGIHPSGSGLVGVGVRDGMIFVLVGVGVGGIGQLTSNDHIVWSNGAYTLTTRVDVEEFLINDFNVV